MQIVKKSGVIIEADCSMAALDPGLVGGIMSHYGVYIQTLSDKTISVQTLSIHDQTLIDDLRFLFNRTIKLVFTEKEEIVARIKQVSQKNTRTTKKYVSKSGSWPVASPVIGLVNATVVAAISANASDIHFEPFEGELRVRYRIDGVLRDVNAIQKSRMAEVVSRLKIMANMDIAEKRRPQDGRIRIEHEDAVIDLRVSTLPTEFGEKVVLRILDKSHLGLDVEKIGMDGKRLDLFKKAIKLPYGMILVTGPTGSGKTTTLYAALNYIKSPEINIVTIEDPIEYNLDGVNQSQVKPEINYTFSEAIKTFLRQDPNVIMVGEVRDTETATIANRAAMTGHLVFSTLHTNDAPSAVNRLVDLGLAPFQIASAVSLIIAQRLVRKICDHCKKEKPIPAALQEELKINDTTAWVGEGCEACGNTGYKGRIGLFEAMFVTGPVKELIMRKANSYELQEVAIREGMVTLRNDGLNKMRAGITTVEEILRETVQGM
ncbi:MAG: hypothetical protein A2268_04210 [Candidatus Raymondbacteria bacterium RifOxyA12_full_50_37]|uniref:Bacterial type II secretion system protein E domain-containing protein n=1 Tax=Candidatus Raymondbacteria bacterium RIFOXYD12_FULL_49_13 TaxID=1817890 RepID=A0A1F7FBB5_UNCRA|nr:MAG: hypothetical protein A2268_04210 [Candidatus Raymondbacteria bacterium RifOxyA12_full_50_37]OGJ92573.1 MAG: hypothetical protein A2248_05740 [Candidatus Raymondbacteria bacterium RIFOXYA2_FULL_49_16]OGJ92865.1 MAG: hypothetical protein A2350_16830 [Candidatus Raymondbacteria bacterium RifOxyB12_full_50_8]OGJ97927.1 MAG: hypothetical protein A2453_02765 [Candidatus Raymondbacteria bacterium RIFOXYC2_FULL_50_21]OGK03959.1 MAG: hypothetical protein A2519_04520 [Candidatus Raymondbacteria b